MSSWPKWDLMAEGVNSERSKSATQEERNQAAFKSIQDRLAFLEKALNTASQSLETKLVDLGTRVSVVEKHQEESVIDKRRKELSDAQTSARGHGEVSHRLNEMHSLLMQLQSKNLNLALPAPATNLALPAPATNVALPAPSASPMVSEREAPRSHANSSHNAGRTIAATTEALPEPRARSPDSAESDAHQRSRGGRLHDEATEQVEKTDRDRTRPEKYLRKIVDKVEEGMVRRHEELKVEVNARIDAIQNAVPPANHHHHTFGHKHSMSSPREGGPDHSASNAGDSSPATPAKAEYSTTSSHKSRFSFRKR